MSKEIIKNKFKNGMIPNENDFWELIDFAGESDAEVIQARGEHTVLKDRLDESDAQLAQTKTQIKAVESIDKSLETANSDESLKILNYLGNYQNVHPKVLYFANGWNGYKYWMAYTPYPYGNTAHENPCISVSNNKVDWVVPDGLVNPLDPGDATDYNSDTHLLYRQDLNRLEIWWRQRDSVNNQWLIWRRTSINGVIWTEKELLLNEDMMSLCVHFENNIYKMWYITDKVMYRESTDASALTWSAPITLDIDWASQKLTPWHMDLIQSDLGYEMIVTAYETGIGNNNTADLYHVVQSLDGTFTKPRLILKKSANPTALDSVGIYRSTFIKVNGMYYMFYSAIGANGGRCISLSTGENIYGLNGYSDKRKGNRVVRMASGSTLTDYDVSNVDGIMFSTGQLTTINSFVGGEVGKELQLIIQSNSASIKLVHGSRLLLPNNADYLLKPSTRSIITLVCVGDNMYRAEVSAIEPKLFYNIPANTTVDNLDVSNRDIITLGGSGIVINSLAGAAAGKVIHFVCTSGSTSAIFKYGTKLITPGLTDYTLTPTKMGVTAIHMGNDVWRVF